MTDYLVRWEVNVADSNPVAAAETARQHQVRSGTTAVVFQVRPLDDPLEARWDLVDLQDPEHLGVQWEYNHKALFEMARKLVADGGDLDAVLEMLEKPWKWPELLSAVTLDRAFDAVSPGKDEPDVAIEDPPETYHCRYCGVVVRLDDKGVYSTGMWFDPEGPGNGVVCEKSHDKYHRGEPDDE